MWGRLEGGLIGELRKNVGEGHGGAVDADATGGGFACNDLHVGALGKDGEERAQPVGAVQAVGVVVDDDFASGFCGSEHFGAVVAGAGRGGNHGDPGGLLAQVIEEIKGGVAAVDQEYFVGGAGWGVLGGEVGDRVDEAADIGGFEVFGFEDDREAGEFLGVYLLHRWDSLWGVCRDFGGEPKAAAGGKTPAPPLCGGLTPPHPPQGIGWGRLGLGSIGFKLGCLRRCACVDSAGHYFNGCKSMAANQWLQINGCEVSVSKRRRILRLDRILGQTELNDARRGRCESIVRFELV